MTTTAQERFDATWGEGSFAEERGLDWDSRGYEDMSPYERSGDEGPDDSVATYVDCEEEEDIARCEMDDDERGGVCLRRLTPLKEDGHYKSDGEAFKRFRCSVHGDDELERE
jgi:hypothetical protein